MANIRSTNYNKMEDIQILIKELELCQQKKREKNNADKKKEGFQKPIAEVCKREYINIS